MYGLNRRATRAVPVFALGVAALFVVFLAATPARAQDNGKGTYQHKCAVCHGPDGAGKTMKGRKLKVKPVSETIKKYSEEQMIEIATKGKGVNMDGFQKELSKDQIAAVVKYYRSLASK
ncbi:MAG TPA: cytochrome c [Terriglobia bacterium]|nr:cytochrome c [Terriglobia bacterium]